MPYRLPPHIGWPLFILSLLGLSIGACVVTVLAARSDGGAQVIEDYYQKAVRWDEHAARQAASAALEWSVTVTVGDADATSALRSIDVRFLDRNGAAIEHLRGTVQAHRPQHTDGGAPAPFHAVPTTPGLYRATWPLTEAGLWNVDITAERDSLHFQTTVRVEIRP